MALRNVYVAGGNGIGYTYEVDSPSDYTSIPNTSYFKDLSLGVEGMILYKDGTGQVIEIYASLAGKQDLLVSNVNIKTVNGITILGTGNVSTYSNTGNIIYVATTGSDTFPDTTRISRLGSINVPFLTLEAAQAVAVSGDLIHVFAGDYTPVSNIAKDGVSYYFEPNAKVTMTTVAHIFDLTGFVTSFNVFGHGEFYKTTSTGYILYGSSGVGGYEMVFEARKVYSTVTHCFYHTVGMYIHFKVSYAKSTAGKVLALPTGSVVKIDAHIWTSTANNVIGTYTSVINNCDLTVNADYFESTSSEGIYGFSNQCNLNLNINKLLGASYGLSTYGAYDSTVVVLNCSYVNAIFCWSNIRFSGHCGSLTTGWNGQGQYAFIGGTCQYVTCGAGYVETTLGGSSTAESSVSISSGTVIIKECIGNTFGVQINSTGGELHMYMLKKDNTGRSRVVNGGTVYLYDVSMSTAIGIGDHSPIIKLQSGTLYLRGRIAITNTTGNPYDPNNPTTLTQTNKSNIVVWTGGNLILDGCTLITQDQNDLPILSRTANQVLRITSKGCTTNRPELGGLIAAKQEKILITVTNVSYPTVNQTINTGVFSVNFSTVTSGKTIVQVATDLCTLINADLIPVTATDNGDGSYYLEADVAGDPFTYTLYNQPYTNGQLSLQGNIIRDNSYAMLNPMGGQIIESSYIF